MRARDCPVDFGCSLYEDQIIASYDALALVEHFGHAPYIESRFVYHNLLLRAHPIEHYYPGRGHFMPRGLRLPGFILPAPNGSVLDVEEFLTPLGAALGGEFQFNSQSRRQLTSRAREVIEYLAPHFIIRFED
jgi:hypothetical protein